MAVVVRLLILFVLFVSGEALICYSGMRDLVDGRPINNFFYGEICNETEMCTLNSYPTSMSGMSVIKELAGCSDPSYIFPCNESGFLLGVLDTTGCTSLSCDIDACNKFASPVICRSNSEYELRITPSCTLTQLLDKLTNCWANLLGGYPYSDVSRCRANIDSGFQCLVQTVNTCAQGPCLTDLDLLPLGLPYIYPIIPQYTMIFSNVASLFALMNIDLATQNEIISAVCLQKNSIYVQQIVPIINYMELNLTYENPVCDNRVATDIFEWFLGVIPSLVNAESHSTWCSKHEEGKAMVLEIWATRCNKSMIGDFFVQMLPAEGYAYLKPKLGNVVNTIEDFLTNYELPRCDGSLQDNTFDDNSSETAYSCTQMQKMFFVIVVSLTSTWLLA